MFKQLSSENQRDRLTQVLRYSVFKSGIPQRPLAEKMGKSQSYVAHILTGDRSLDFVDWYLWLTALDMQESEFIELLDKGVGLEEDWVKD